MLGLQHSSYPKIVPLITHQCACISVCQQECDLTKYNLKLKKKMVMVRKSLT